MDVEQLLALLKDCPAPGTRWRHYRGGLYVVTGSAVDEGTLEPLVLYRPHGGVPTWARPLRSWNGGVGTTEGGTVRRFTRED